jgi:two-component system CheB/CheR fusion protein
LTLEANQDFEALLEYLRDSRGFDFTGYKRTTLVRRVAKRCTELGFDAVGDYVDYLQVHKEEFAILFDKILINVTEFFRDKPAWDYLAQKVVPQIVQRDGNIRVWSTGVASGEEAYSAAIVFCEALGTKSFLDRVKIYATDVDEQALSTARAGQYSSKELESLDPMIRSQYFEVQNGRFAFRPALRRALIFGMHDLMHDAPISRLDLLICRNTLIYFTAEAQERILNRFHYALKDQGHLFLGRAEMLLTRSALFQPADLKHRIFKKVPLPEFRDRLKVPTPPRISEAVDQVAREHRVRELAGEATPFAQVVVDGAGTLVLANQQARALFSIGPGDIGRPLKDLALSYRPIELRSPIEQSLRDRRTVLISGVQHALPDGAVKHLDVQVAPLFDHDGTVAGTGVSFIDVTRVVELRSELDRSKQDLETSYEELQSANEELETTNEELQSTIEELETTNEELQSTNEELETMNEELESTNSELQSSNSDLHQRTDEVERFNVLLHSITGNIPLGAVVMNADLKVTVWNERAADLWGLRTDEVVGKSFFDLDIGLPTEEMRNMIGEVLSGRPAHDEIVLLARNRRGNQIRCRVRASFFSDGAQSGAVVLVMEEVKPENKPNR